MRGVARGLLGKFRPGDRGLPDVGGDRLNFVILQAELRHLRGGTEIARVADPVRNPFLVNLHPDFFQVRTDLLDFLQQVVRTLIERFDLRVHARHRDGQVGGFRVIPVGGGVVGGGVALLIQLGDLQASSCFWFSSCVIVCCALTSCSS